MTIAEQLRIEGMQKGREEGSKEKAIDVAKHLLYSKVQLDLEFIAETTGLSIEQIKVLKEPL